MEGANSDGDDSGASRGGGCDDGNEIDEARDLPSPLPPPVPSFPDFLPSSPAPLLRPPPRSREEDFAGVAFHILRPLDKITLEKRGEKKRGKKEQQQQQH